MLSTMVYADEINDPREIAELADLDDVELPDKELAMAEQLIESLSRRVRARTSSTTPTARRCSS